MPEGRGPLYAVVCRPMRLSAGTARIQPRRPELEGSAGRSAGAGSEQLILDRPRGCQAQQRVVTQVAWYGPLDQLSPQQPIAEAITVIRKTRQVVNLGMPSTRPGDAETG
jgi:hypothetical protein